jgi:uracil-DNA glycosylase
LAELAGAVREARACRLCAPHLPHGPRPILQLGRRARILLVSQAPGRHAHHSGIPFDDRSGDRLRAWLGLDRAAFYDPDILAILPIGFCYPGHGTRGDLLPRPECAPTWHARLLALMPELRLTLLIGRPAQARYLPEARPATLTEVVRRYRDYLPDRFPLPHPSPRNGPWLLSNRWFERDVLPALRAEVRRARGRS